MADEAGVVGAAVAGEVEEVAGEVAARAAGAERPEVRGSRGASLGPEPPAPGAALRVRPAITRSSARTRKARGSGASQASSPLAKRPGCTAVAAERR